MKQFFLLAAAAVMLSVSLACTPHSSPESRLSLSLNGSWDFYPNGDSTRYDIQVPSFWDAPQDYGYPEEWLHLLHGVYKHSFVIPSEMADKQIFLEMKRISVIAKVFVNGTQVGGEESLGYLMMQLPYRIDITDLARIGEENQIEVLMWGGQQETFGENVAAEWKEQDFPGDVLDDGNMLLPWCVDHYDGRRGINGDVNLIAMPKVYIEDVYVIPDLKKNEISADDELHIETAVVNQSDEDAAVELRHYVKDLVECERSDTVASGFNWGVSLGNIPCPDSHYWWPHDPNLYELITELRVDGQLVDVKTTRFGMRQFYVDGNHFKLNGRKVNLRAESFEFSWHEGYIHGPSTCPVLSTKELTVDVQKRFMDAYRELNFNTLRVHKASGIDATYDYADETGMLVIDEVPFWQTQQRTDARAKDNFQAWVRQWIKVRRNHPSIVLWDICNECWGSPIPGYTYAAAKEVDNTRPIYHQGIRPGDFEGDELCVHYTGGYPMGAYNTADLYSVYENHPNKPKGEGESMFAEGWPLKNEDGSLSEKRSERGEYDNPDMLSQAEWMRGAARMVRAMRYAGLADSRSYMNWIYAFESIETDIYPQWPDMTAPEIKPKVLHRPVCQTFTDAYPQIIHGDGHEYWKDSHAPVAVFDLQFDQDNRLGVLPPVYQAGDALNRKLAVYNDALTGGESLTVRWTAVQQSVETGKAVPLVSDTQAVAVPYGEKKEITVSVRIPEVVESKTWLVWKLEALKNGIVEFEEDNRIGALGGYPAPKLVISNPAAELNPIPANSKTQLKKIKLVNAGGGLSEKWTLEGTDRVVHVTRSSGNCRGEEEFYYWIDTAGLRAGQNVRKVLKVKGASGSETEMVITFQVIEDEED